MSQGKALQLLKEGITAAKSGNKPLTRRLLGEVTQLDPRNEVAWLWMAGVAESPRESIAYLKRVLEINPANERALLGLKTARLQAGIAACKTGDKGLARLYLTEVTRDDPNNEVAWLWMAGVSPSPAEAISCLERVLRINPANERAQAGLNFYRSQLPLSTPAWTCPLCQTGASKAMNRCETCGAVVALTDVDTVLYNQVVDIARLRRAVDRLEEALRQKSDFQTRYHLGLAFLNLKQIDQGLEHLRVASSLRLSDSTLRLIVSGLIQRKAKNALEDSKRRDTDSQPSKRRNGVEPPKPSLRQGSILIVDDSPTMRKLVTMTMERHGFKVRAAADGREAMDQIRAGLPDLILLDITMPGMDGYQVCRQIRQNNATRHIPVVMLSGKDGFFNKVRGRLAGSTDYITKPFEPDYLVSTVQRHYQASKNLVVAGNNA